MPKISGQENRGRGISSRPASYSLRLLSRSQGLGADSIELVASHSWGRHGGVILGLGKPRQEDEFKGAWAVKQDSVSKLREEKVTAGSG